MKKIVTVILALCFVFAMATPAFATEVINESAISAVSIGNGTYYTEETDTYRLVIGIVGNIVDCAVTYFSAPNEVLSLVQSIPDKLNNKNDKEVFAYYKQVLLDGKTALKKTTVRTEVILEPTNQERSSIENIFLEMLYLEGEPRPQSSLEIYHGWQNGVKCTAYRTISYNIYEYTIWHFLSDMAISEIMSISGLSKPSLLSILTFVFDAASQIMRLFGNQDLTKYNIYAFHTKNMKINNATWYTASRTVFWNGYKAIGQMVLPVSDTKHYAYDDNALLIKLAFNSYFN